MSFGGSSAADDMVSRGAAGLQTGEDRQGDLFNQSNDFSQNFWNNFVRPRINESRQTTNQTLNQLADLFDRTRNGGAFRENYFRQTGIPQINNFLGTVADFSSDEYAARMGDAAAGDLYAQERLTNEQLNRALASRGVSANSGAAISAINQNSLYTGLAIADAKRRAREAADAQKINLQGAAADVGMATQSWALPYTQMAGQLAEARQGVQGAGLSQLAIADQIRRGGLQTSASINQPLLQGNYGLYSNGQQLAAQSEQANAAGVGQFLGSAGALGLGFMTGNPLLIAQGGAGLTGSASGGSFGLMGLGKPAPPTDTGWMPTVQKTM